MDPISNILASLFGNEFLQSIEFVFIAWLVALRIIENDILVVIRGYGLSYVGFASSLVFDFLER